MGRLSTRLMRGFEDQIGVEYLIAYSHLFLISDIVLVDIHIHVCKSIVLIVFVFHLIHRWRRFDDRGKVDATGTRRMMMSSTVFPSYIMSIATVNP